MAETEDDQASDAQRVYSLWKIFCLAFTVAFLAMAIWSTASPLFTGPDEPTHVMKAAAVVRGQLFATLGPGQPTVANDSPNGLVTLPRFYAVDRKVPRCVHGAPTIPASCLDALKYQDDSPVVVASNAAAIVALPHPVQGVRCPTGTPPGAFCADYAALIYNVRYPPLYYAIVGLPSLLGNADWAVYLMRLLSAALSAVFLAFAVATAIVYSRSRLALCGVIVAATPMALYLGAVVNPTGLEVSSAIAVWTAGAVLVRERITDPPTGLVAILMGSACVFESVRGLSPFWLALTALALFSLARPRAVIALLARRFVQIGLGAVIVVGAVAVAWIVHEHTLDVYTAPHPVTIPFGTPELTILSHSLARTSTYVPGMVGVFGSFDTFAPLFSYICWYCLLAVLGIAAVVLRRGRAAAVVVGLAILIVAVPVLISSSQAHKYGYIWSGRDTLAFATGLPIVAAVLLGERERALPLKHLVTVVATFAGLAQFAAFYEALRRYAVGTLGGDVTFLVHPRWQPPLGVLASVVAELIILVLGGALAIRAVRVRPTAAMTEDSGRENL